MAMLCVMLPVTLMYARPTLNELDETSLPSASLIFGACWNV